MDILGNLARWATGTLACIRPRAQRNMITVGMDLNDDAEGEGLAAVTLREVLGQAGVVIANTTNGIGVARDDAARSPCMTTVARRRDIACHPVHGAWHPKAGRGFANVVKHRPKQQSAQRNARHWRQR